MFQMESLVLLETIGAGLGFRVAVIIQSHYFVQNPVLGIQSPTLHELIRLSGGVSFRIFGRVEA